MEQRQQFVTRVDATSLVAATAAEASSALAEVHADSWISAETGIGTELDKRTSHHFFRGRLSYEEIARLWEQDAIAAKAIEKPSFEAYREGYEFEFSDESSYDDLKEDLVDGLDELELDAAMQRAHQLKRAFGGSLILIGADDGRPMDQELDERRVRSLDWLNVLEPIEVYPVEMYEDPGQPKHGKPRLFEINSTRRAGLLPGGSSVNARAPKIKPGALVHESRCIVFQGIRASDYAMQAATGDVSPFWGSSMMHRFVDALRDHGVAYAAAGLLPVDMSQPVIGIENLKELLAKKGDTLRNRMRNIEISRSVARAILIDKKTESYERQTTQLANIPELLDRLSQRLAGDVDTPLSVLIGYSPASLGAPDDKETTLWHNIVRALQKHEFTRPTKRIAAMKMRTLRQRRLPKRLGITWRPLEHQTQQQEAESQRVQAQTDSMYIKAGMAYPDELRRSRWKGGYSHKTQIDERKPAPGFIAALPAGVVPGSTPAVHGRPGAPAAMGPNAHPVSGYARRNPTPPALGANPKQGGDVSPVDNRDRADAVATFAQLAGMSESAYQRSMLERLRRSGNATPASMQLVEQLVAQAEVDERDAHEAGECMSYCPFEHATADADRAGEHRVFAGLSVVVEYPRGSVRSWTAHDGTSGSTPMEYDYGYLVGVRGADGDSVDCYLGPTEEAQMVYVVHQMSPASGFTAYDEDKVMLGFDGANHARDAYLRQYVDARFLGGITPMPLVEFKAALATLNATAPAIA